ncbi:MAG: PAS domain S-box protein [Gemmatimonadota bacterium]
MEGLQADAYRAVFEAAPDGVVIVDRSGTIRALNPQALVLFGYPAEDELLGQPVEVLVPKDSREAHQAHRDRYADHPVARPMGIGMELVGRRRDGSEFPVEISLSPVKVGGEPLIIGAVRDVSERVRLRNFRAAALRAAEDERRRIAQELHDDMAQRLSTLLLFLRLVREASDSSAREAQLEEMRGQLLEAAEGVRRIARGLRPPALERVGVGAALRTLVSELRESGGPEISLEMDPVDECLTDDGKLVLYRAVQEAISNVVRHAEASRARVGIGIDGDRVVARIEDDGCGFDVARAQSAGRLGLIGMRERALMVGGRVSVESQPGSGTRVLVEIPCREEEADG